MNTIGLDMFHYAKITKDDTTGVTYETPVSVPGLRKFNITVNGSNSTLFADNGPWETAASLGKIATAIEMAELGLEHQAALLGHTVTKGVLEKKATDEAPYVAIMCRATKGNGKHAYIKILKTRFTEPSTEVDTKEENVAFKTPTINGEAVQRKYDKGWMRVADEDATGYEDVSTSWFASVDATV